MVKRIAGIVFVFLCTAVAWLILAGTVQVRTQTQDSKLRAAVGRIWGEPLHQQAPSVWYETRTTEKVTTRTADAVTTEDRVSVQRHDVALAASRVQADLSYDPRRKGLLWYSTYKVKFRGTYRVANDTGEARSLFFSFPLPSPEAIYDNFQVRVDGRPVAEPARWGGDMGATLEVPAGGSSSVEVSYATQGLDEWWYRFGDEKVTQVRDFALEVHTDFDGFDFPADSVSPTEKRRDGSGWVLTWAYQNLLSGVQPGLVLPKKLNPGPWVSQVTFAAPVSLFLFFFLLFIVATRRGVPLHPMHYFFLAAAFFSFHLLMAYLVDHAPLMLSFVIASAVSLGLTVSYIRAAISPRFAFLEVGLSQLVYQVLFSATFFQEAYTGLSITVLCILTLFAVMQYTARVDWAEAFGGKKAV